MNTPDTDAYKGGHVTTIDLGKYVNKAEGSKSATDGILEGATVTVIVKAKLNKGALISQPGNLQKNPNKVDLEYSTTRKKWTTPIRFLARKCPCMPISLTS